MAMACPDEMCTACKETIHVVQECKKEWSNLCGELGRVFNTFPRSFPNTVKRRLGKRVQQEKVGREKRGRDLRGHS